MSESEPSTKADWRRGVSRRCVLRTTGTVAGAGISAAFLGMAPVGAQQTLNFGEVVVGSSDTRTVSQPNPTDQTLPITGVEITGSDADQFSVVDGDAPFTLQANESRTIGIQFAPTSTGQKSAAVQVEIAGSTTETAGQLTGTGVNETTDQNDDSATDESPSSSQEGTATESTTGASTDTGSEDAVPTEAAASNAQSDADESTAEDSDASPSDRDGSASSENENPSIILMLDFNNNGVVDFQDILTLLRMLS